MSATAGQRFLIRRERLTRALLLAVGLARDSNSYVEIDAGRLHMRFGWLFDCSFALTDVALVEERPGLDLRWRTDTGGLIGVAGSYEGVVEVRLREIRRLSGRLPFIKVGCDRLAISLEEPEAFVAALRRAIPARRCASG